MIENLTVTISPARGLTQPLPTMDERKRAAAMLALVTLLTIPLVLFYTLTGISWYDDEGTLLVGFRSLLDGHRMYDEIYSLYGPLYNAIYGLIYVVLGVPLTHTAGRLIAAALWLSYTAAFAGVCHRLTRSIPAMLFGFLFVLIELGQLMGSPGHPEEICLILLATVLLLACSLQHAPRTALLAGIGAAVAGLGLVKVNIGAYVGSGVLLVLLRASVPSAWTRIAIPTVSAALLLLPFGVQFLLLDFEWVKLYIVFSTLVIGATLIIILDVSMPWVIRQADLLTVAIGAGLTCLVVVGGMMLAGSSPGAILNAAVLQNAHFIRNWYIPLDLGSHGLPTAAASALIAVAYRSSLSRPALAGCRDLGVLALKSSFVVLGFYFNFFAPEELFRTLTPFCWLLVVPSAGIQQRRLIGRAMTALTGAIMSLYPFPVAGHQTSIGALLPVVMICILACDVLADSHKRGIVRFVPVGFSTFLAMTIVLAYDARLTWENAHTYWTGVPLGLPGTSLIRIDRKQAADLRWVTAELSSCTSSYSMPGLPSFTFWTEHALPTGLNINDVLAFIEPAKQREIVRILSQQPDLCVVYNAEYLQFFDRGQIRTDPPLLHYLKSDFVAVAERNGFVILKRPPVAPGAAN